jgi:hypothetical protein
MPPPYKAVPYRADERDHPVNPYTSERPTIQFDETDLPKAFMEPSTHTYLIFDAKGRAYRCHDVTGSKAKRAVDDLAYGVVPVLEELTADTFHVLRLLTASHVRELSGIGQMPDPRPGSRMYYAHMGHLFHWYAENYIKKTVPLIEPPQLKAEVRQFKEFMAQLPPDYINASEISFASWFHKLSGTWDAAHIDHKRGVIILFDWKNKRTVFHKTKIIRKDRPAPNKNPTDCDVFYFKENVEIDEGVVLDRVYYVDYNNIPTSVLECMFQLAFYHKLGSLNGYTAQPKVYMMIMHSELARDHAHTLELDLSRKSPCLNGHCALDIIQHLFDRVRDTLAHRFKLALPGVPPPVKITIPQKPEPVATTTTTTPAPTAAKVATVTNTKPKIRIKIDSSGSVAVTSKYFKVGHTQENGQRTDA